MGRLLRTAGWPGLALVAWTLFTWTTRVPLAWSDDELDLAERLLATVPVLVFVLLAVAAARGLWVGSDRPVGVLAAWSLAYWVVRFPLIALGGHPVGFVVVHAVLAVVAGGLGALVLRSLWARRRVEVEAV